MKNNGGWGIVEIILVLTVLIIFVLIFRNELTGLAVSLCRKWIGNL